MGGGIEVTITGTQRITQTYYSAGAKLIAMRVMTGAVSALYFVHTDHLGSVSLTTDGSGAVVSEQKFTAWGVVRAATGAMPTDVGYTGQRADASTGLMFYGARYYDAYLNRFISADSVVPGAGNPQALNRYSYVLGNPLKYTDPTGHCPIHDDECIELQWHTEQEFGVDMRGDWSTDQVRAYQDALTYIRQKAGDAKGRRIYGGTVAINSKRNRYNGDEGTALGTDYLNGKWTILAFADFWKENNHQERVFLFLHEFGHVWDGKESGRLSGEMQYRSDSHYYFGPFRDVCTAGWPLCEYRPGLSQSNEKLYRPANHVEDFAQAFALYIGGPSYLGHWTYGRVYNTQQLSVRSKILDLMLYAR